MIWVGKGEYPFVHEYPNLTTVGTTARISILPYTKTVTYTIETDATTSNVDVKIEISPDGAIWTVGDNFVGTGSDVRTFSTHLIRYLRIRVDSLGDGTYVKIRILAKPGG